MCDSNADLLVEQAMAEIDPVARATLIAEAEAALTLPNIYIPFGSPLRFSLVRSGVDAFVANPWAFHPLPPLAQIPR
jgi:ABC-type transport system substrate-binding protein